MINKNYKHSELTSKIIGCAMKVHSALGNGFQEVIYQRCLAIEFKHNHLNYFREKENMYYFRSGFSAGLLFFAIIIIIVTLVFSWMGV